MNQNIVVTLLFGALGGVANCILVYEGFSLPRLVKRDSGERLLTAGFLGPLVLGMVAALATYLLGTSKLEELNQWGIALISGVGGGNVLMSLLQRQETTTLKTQVEQMQEVIKKFSQ